MESGIFIPGVVSVIVSGKLTGISFFTMAVTLDRCEGSLFVSADEVVAPVSESTGDIDNRDDLFCWG